MHAIRLAGPWEVVRGDAPPRRVRMPAAWEAVFSTPGTAVFRRRFNRPTGLGEDTRLWLSVREYGGTITVHLDGERIADPAPGEPVRVEVTCLAGSPTLEIEVTAGDGPPPTGLYGPVLLEIEEPPDGEPSDAAAS